MEAPRSDAPRRRRPVRAAALGAAVAVAGLVLAEGLAGVLLLGGDAAAAWRAGDALRHMTHDALLGWTSQPGYSSRQHYGTDEGLTINAQGFRHAGEISPRVPPDRTRIVCSGGTLTFGPGVDDDDTWCAALGRIDDGLETINMGQVAYGADQAYLWYSLDAARLDHDIHVFAVSTGDLERMRVSRVRGRAKPRLEIAEGSLGTRDVPVPPRSWLGLRLGGVLWLASRSRSAALVRRATGAAPAEPRTSPAGDPLHAVVPAILDELVSLHRRAGVAGVLVFLPEPGDRAGTSSDAWRRAVRDAARNRLPFVDLVAELRAAPPGGLETFYLHGRDDEAVYSPAGHEFLARALHRRLQDLALLRALLDGAAARRP